LQFSGAAQTFFDLDADGRPLGTCPLLSPPAATPGTPYTIQINYPSASSYAAPNIGGPPIDVFVQAPTNGPTTGTRPNAIKLITVLTNNSPASAHLVGDVFPFTWYNIGDFGDGLLQNDDVIETMEYAGAGNFPNNPFFDAMDSSDGSVNNYYTASDATIDLITHWRWLQIDVDDVYVTLRRSLDPRITITPGLVRHELGADGLHQLGATKGITRSRISPPVKLGLSGPRYITVAADQVRPAATSRSRCPSAFWRPTPAMRVLMLNAVEIEPLDGSPAITTAVSFSAVTNLGRPPTRRCPNLSTITPPPGWIRRFRA
jgi:hypothetical protein